MNQGGNNGYLLLHAVRIGANQVSKSFCNFKHISVFLNPLRSGGFIDVKYICDEVQILDTG